MDRMHDKSRDFGIRGNIDDEYAENARNLTNSIQKLKDTVSSFRLQPGSTLAKSKNMMNKTDAKLL